MQKKNHYLSYINSVGSKSSVYVIMNGKNIDKDVANPSSANPILRHLHNGYIINGASTNNCVSADRYHD